MRLNQIVFQLPFLRNRNKRLFWAQWKTATKYIGIVLFKWDQVIYSCYPVRIFSSLLLISAIFRQDLVRVRWIYEIWLLSVVTQFNLSPFLNREVLKLLIDSRFCVLQELFSAHFSSPASVTLLYFILTTSLWLQLSFSSASNIQPKFQVHLGKGAIAFDLLWSKNRAFLFAFYGWLPNRIFHNFRA